MKKRPGRPCKACAHPRRPEIDAHAARPAARVARTFGLSVGCIARHRTHATPPSSETIPGPPLRPRDVAPWDVFEGDSADARTVALETLAALRGALRGAPREDVPKIANAITSSARLLARVSGQLEISEAHIVRSLPWRHLMGLLDGVLHRHPAAAADWAQALAEVDT